MPHSIALASVLVFAIPHVAFAASAADWRSRSIYQVVTDRFATSDHTNPPCDPDAKKYCGGTWQGIINELDYIEAMGFDAVWISPVVSNIDEETYYGESYLGYWTQDMDSLNSHFGTPEDLRALSAALHERKMYLMVDVLVNHYAVIPSKNKGNDTSFSVDFDKIAPLSSESAFHPQCFITDHDNQTEIEQCWLGDHKLPMLDIDTENSTNFKMLNSWVANLVEEYKVDGLRVSNAKHVRQGFWKDFISASGVFAIGEVLSDNVTYTSGYTEVLDGVLDYPTWFKLIAAFSSTKGDFSELIRVVTQSQEEYSTGLVTAGSFVENASQPRFANLTSDESLNKNIIAWPFLHDGIPITYYGQEQGLSGGQSPANHEPLWSTTYKTYRKPLIEELTALNAARHIAIASKEGFLTNSMSFIPQKHNNHIAVSKPPLLGLLSNVGNSSTAKWTIPGDAGLFLKGETLMNVLTCQSYEVDVTGGLTVESRYGLPVVILPSRFLDVDGPLCRTSASLSANSALAIGVPWTVNAVVIFTLSLTISLL